MSNSLAIATVTAALGDLVLGVARDTNSNAKVLTGWPDRTMWGSGEVGVNLFLYSVAPNGAWRNEDVPTRDADGNARRKPQAALGLRYLLSFFGDEVALEPQRILGGVVSLLHGQPLLDRDRIASVVGNTAALTGSDLDLQPELVRFTPLPLSLEDLSKLWTTFPQSGLAVSVAYEGSVVLLEADVDVHPPLPVQDRDGRGITFQYPEIDSVEAAAGPTEPIMTTSMLLVRGRRLAAEETRVRIDGADFVPASMSDTQLGLPVPADLPAGVHRLQVVQLVSIGRPETPHAGAESNVAPFVLRPTAELYSTTGTGAARVVTVDVTPTVREGQRATLLLNEQPGGTGRSYRFDRPPETGDLARLPFTVGDVGRGVYALRVQVDGAQSPIRPLGGVQPPRFDPEVTIW